MLESRSAIFRIEKPPGGGVRKDKQQMECLRCGKSLAVSGHKDYVCESCLMIARIEMGLKKLTPKGKSSVEEDEQRLQEDKKKFLESWLDDKGNRKI